MHIEAGVVSGAKMVLSYATATGVIGMGAKLAWENIRDNGIVSFVLKSLLATIIVFCCFEVLPHYPVGVSEVHLILGTTIFLVFGIAPAMVGLALGLLIQGLFFAQFDLPQYGINVTTLLASMLILYTASKKIIPENIAYKDISYSQMLKMSIIWEGAIVGWVAFWAFYGQGFSAENLHNVATFGGAYMLVVIIEPLIDLAVLSAVKAFNSGKCNILFDKRLNNCRA
ncbi:MAG: cobalt transporter [Epsilonproteobacteria bacterium]|nr:cobalt transporter [Campylobacterota bacterium]